MTARWPLFDLRIYADDLELRLPDIELLEQLGCLAAEGIHDPSFMPFDVPWSDKAPLPRARATMQWHWHSWATLKPETWRLELVVLRDGQLVGTQGVGAEDFRVKGEVTTGSWLGRQFQGQGIGKMMRSAVLGLAFDGLGADSAVSSAFNDNPSSTGVSRSLGYADDGVTIKVRRGERAEQQRFRMTREVWLQRARPVVRIEGLEPCLPFLIEALPTSE